MSNELSNKVLNECWEDPGALSYAEMPSEFREQAWASHNHLWSYDVLQNTYYAMRHGFSVSNGKGITASNPEIACRHYGITGFGARQVREQTLTGRAAGWFDEGTIIVSSDFKRCRQSAIVACEELGVAGHTPVPWLRERFFGDLDLLDHELFFSLLHPFDVEDPFSNMFNCESTVQVLERVSRGIVSLEREFSGKTILLVTHHDTMQILERAFAKKSPARYAGTPEKPRRQIDNAEIRSLYLR